jgi:hypothetical protein
LPAERSRKDQAKIDQEVDDFYANCVRRLEKIAAATAAREKRAEQPLPEKIEELEEQLRLFGEG